MKKEQFKKVMAKTYNGLYSTKGMLKQMGIIGALLLLFQYNQYDSFMTFLQFFLIMALMIIMVVALEKLTIKLLLSIKLKRIEESIPEDQIGHYTFQNKMLLMTPTHIAVYKMKRNEKKYVYNVAYSDIQNCLIQHDPRKNFFQDFSKVEKYYISIELKTGQRYTVLTFADENTEARLKDEYQKMSQKINK